MQQRERERERERKRERERERGREHLSNGRYDTNERWSSTISGGILLRLKIKKEILNEALMY